MTALHHAVLTGNADLVRVLLDSGSEVDVIDKRGLRPLHYAAWKGDFALVELLCRHCNGATAATVNPRSADGYTPLHVAAEHGHHAVVERLLRWGADPLRVNDRGRTPLDVACEFGRNSVVDLLTNWIPATRLITVDKHQTTCLHLASRNGHIETIRALLHAGVDINIRTQRGTCLHEAAMFGKAEVVGYLLSHGADVNRVNSYEQTALDIVSKFTANRAAHQIEQMLKDTGITTSDKSVHSLRNTISLSQTCSDLPVSRDLDATNHERQLSGNFSDACGVRLSESSPSMSSVIRTDSNDGKHTRGSKTQCTELNSAGNDAVGLFSESCVTSPSPGSSTSSLTSASLDSLSPQMDGKIDQECARHEESNNEAVQSWLASLQLAEYAHLFIGAGYDLPTMTRMTPEDLTAIGVTKPSVRKRLKFEIGRLETRDPIPDFRPANVKNLLRLLNLDEYQETLSRQGYNEIDSLLEITWEDLEEIGIRKLGHQKKMMLVVDRFKRLNRCVRSATPNGSSGTLSLRRTMSAASDYRTVSPSSRVTVVRTHSGLSDSRHSRGKLRPSNIDFAPTLDTLSRSSSASMSYRTPSNSFRSLADESRSSASADGVTCRPRSRQTSSSESSPLNASFTAATRATPPLSLTTAATMPDIIGRTRSNGDSNSATGSPSSTSDQTPTNEWKSLHQAPLFAAYCNRQRQLETSGLAAFAEQAKTSKNRFVQSGPPRRTSIDSVEVCRPSAKVLPSPKAPSTFDDCSESSIRTKPPVEGVSYQNGKPPITVNPAAAVHSMYGTLPRRRVLPIVQQRTDEGVHHLDRSSKKQPESDVGGTGYPLLVVKSSSENVESDRVVSEFPTTLLKPLPPKRTYSVKTRSSEHHQPTCDDDKDRSRRAAHGVRRHDSGSSADRRGRNGELVAMMTLRPGSWPNNIQTNGAHGTQPDAEPVGECRTEVMSNGRCGNTSDGITSSMTSSSGFTSGSLPKTAAQCDTTNEGVMPFANEDMATIKLHRIALAKASTKGATVGGTLRHVTWQQSESPRRLRHDKESSSGNGSLDDHLGKDSSEDGSWKRGGDCCHGSAIAVNCNHDNEHDSEADISSMLLEDIDGMLNGLAAELDMMLQMHS